MKRIIIGVIFIAVCSSCPSGWVKFEDECYWFERSNRMSWENAKNRCISMKSYLVKVYSDRENSFIRNELKKLHPGLMRSSLKCEAVCTAIFVHENGSLDGPYIYRNGFAPRWSTLFPIRKVTQWNGRKTLPCQTTSDQYWTAGNDLQREGQFVWAGTNDLIVEYTDWSPSEPNQNGGEEDCIAFFPVQDFHWNDEHCNVNAFFICEQLDPSAGGIVG